MECSATEPSLGYEKAVVQQQGAQYSAAKVVNLRSGGLEGGPAVRAPPTNKRVSQIMAFGCTQTCTMYKTMYTPFKGSS